tara:strand:+ start:41 stop:418 length:378 start_codon:yes stop_codon:yes gene_type:complete
MTLKDFATADGLYAMGDDSYEYAEDLIHTGILGFCGCGCKDKSLAYIRAGLAFIDAGFRAEMPYEDFRALELATFKTDGAAYFFYYWADAEELTEHGGSVPGWLTGKGRDVLHLLDEEAALEEAP